MNTTFQDDFMSPIQNNSLLNTTWDSNQEQGNSDVGRKLKVAQAIVLTISFLGIFVNFISILALKKSKDLRNSTTTFIINLCLADMLYCVSNLITYLRHDWNKIDYVCRWNTLAKYFFSGESVYLMSGITINRFICVVYPNIYRIVYKPTPLILQIAFTWLFAFAWSLFPLFEVWGKYGYDVHVGLCTILKVNGISMSRFIFIFAFVGPTTTFAICYPVIFCVTHKSYKRSRMSNRIRSPAGLNAVTGEENVRPKKTSFRMDDRERKILKVMLVIVVAFMLCYFPLGFVKIFNKDKEMPIFVLFGYFAINMSNVINPIIYIVMSTEYRKAYLELFQCRKN